MTKTSLERVVLVIVSMALGASGSRTRASGFQITENNTPGLGNAHSGQAAAAEDASTIFANPAGLTRIPGYQLVGAFHVIGTHTHFQDRGSTPATLQPTLGNSGGTPGNVALVPNGYVSFETIPGMLWTGVGVNVPFGLKTEWDPGWIGRFHAVKSEVRTVNINPTVAWKIARWLSIGAGANAQWIDAELTNSVNYSAIAFGSGGAPALGALAAGGCGTLAGGCEGIGRLKGNAWDWGWNVGVMLEAPTQTRVGLAYRSRITHRVEGTASFGNRPALLAAALPDGPARTTIELPDSFSVAVAQQVLPALQLLADFTWTSWSTIRDLSVFRTTPPPPPQELSSTPLRFKDSWRTGIGANYQVTEPLKLRFGAAFDRTPVRTGFRDPRLPDQNRWWLATGAQWAFSRMLAVDLAFAYLVVPNATSNLPNVDPNPPPGFSATPQGALVGEYTDNDAWIASAQVRVSF